MFSYASALVKGGKPIVPIVSIVSNTKIVSIVSNTKIVSIVPIVTIVSISQTIDSSCRESSCSESSCSESSCSESSCSESSCSESSCDDSNCNDYTNDSESKLPGGKIFQRGGARLETKFKNAMPNFIQKHLFVNFKPLNEKGNFIVEYDMVYFGPKKTIYSFEIKGLNSSTTNSAERQAKLIKQGLRQKQYLIENFVGYKIKSIYCFVTGYINDEVNGINGIGYDFLDKIRAEGLYVAIGRSPQQCAANALKTLGLC
jgi:hypothetical protein